MLKRLANWYTEWERELLDVMDNPALAARCAPGYRRSLAMRVVAMSELERRQMRDFCLRWPGARFAKACLGWVALFAGIGVVAHLVRPDWPLLKTVVLAELGGSILLWTVLGVLLSYRSIVRDKLRVVARVMVGGVCGVLAGLVANAVVSGRPLLDVIRENAPLAIQQVAMGLGVALVVVLAVSAWRNAGFERIAIEANADAERERLARQLTETQLRLLHAQIEPHFLFNTLGAVQQLAERDQATAAAELTANLIAFLRSTASGMAQEMASLHDEFALARAYLNVMKARLGKRLEVVVDLPAELAGCRLPGMAVLTLAENAVKHGAETSPHPTRISVTAVLDQGRLRVLVSDTGAGLSDTPSGGIGLRNLRDRLRLAFGPGATVSLSEQDGGGVLAEIAMPVRLEQGVAA